MLACRVHDLQISHFVIVNACEAHLSKVSVNDTSVITGNSSIHSSIHKSTSPFDIVCGHKIVYVCTV
jgi:hypothetical protein